MYRRHASAPVSPQIVVRARLCVATTIVVLLAAGAPATASAAERLSIRAPHSVVADGLINVHGVGAGRSNPVRLERRLRGGWRVVASGRASDAGAFILTLFAPAKPTRLVLRAVVSHGRRVVSTSVGTRLRVTEAPASAAGVVVSRKTTVVAPSLVSAAPVPGQQGQLVYSGGNTISVGQIVVVGQGPATPDGFIGRVTGVQASGTATTLDTTPATLEQAVPQGGLDITTATATVSREFARTASALSHALSCSGSASASASGSISFSSSLHMTGSWSLLHGITSASVSANASVAVSASASLNLAGQCTLAKTRLLYLPGPSAAVFIGPVPVVLTSSLSVYLDASASASAAISTSASAQLSATAGVAWSRGGGFSPIDTLTPSFNYSPPSASASASADINVTPTLDVDLYGVAGPEIALKAGTAFNASTTANPWWSLTAPISLTASLAIPSLDLSSPSLNLYSHTFSIANPGGPSGSNPPPSGGSGPGSGQTYTSVTPLGPTSGPAGFGLVVGTPGCSGLLAINADGSLFYREGFSPAGTNNTMWGADTIVPNATTALSAGTHQLSFACESLDGTDVVWTDPGFSVTVTGAPASVTLQSTTAPPGGELTFTSGASSGPSPCPVLAGYTAFALDLYLTGSPGPVTASAHFAYPDSARSEALSVPGGTTPGSYTASEDCDYGDPGGSAEVASFNFAAETVTIS